MFKKLKLFMLGLFLLAFGLVGNAQTAQQSNVQQTTQTSVLQQIQQLNAEETALLAEPMTNEIADKLEYINQKRQVLMNTRASSFVPKSQKLVKTDNLLEQATKLNQKYRAENIPFRAKVTKPIGGKQYIQLVELSKQTGQNPTKKQ